jgi:hypothetical protein
MSVELLSSVISFIANNPPSTSIFKTFFIQNGINSQNLSPVDSILILYQDQRVHQNPHVEPHLSQSSFDVTTAEYPKVSAARFPQSPTEISEIVATKLSELNNLCGSKDYSLLSSLFGSTSYWGDHLGLSDTKYTTLVGAKKIIAYIQNNGTDCNIKSFALEKGKEPQVGAIDPRGTTKCLQAFITFESKTGNGRGIITLLQDVENADEWKVFNLFTTFGS